jgi:predicted MPP superfamily phosphohydrolase
VRVSPQFLRLELVVSGALLTLLLAVVGAVLVLRGRSAKAKRLGLWLSIPGALVLTCILYAHFIEPDRVEVTHEEIQTPLLPAGTHLRIVQLSDTHVREWTRALSAVQTAVNDARPDLILFTGDAADSPEGVERFRKLFASLSAPLGRYAVRGNHDFELDPDGLFQGVLEELDGTPVPLLGGKVVLCGASWRHARRIARCLSQSRGAYRIAVYHSPDLIEALAPLSPELYLAGHTHGGQVRLPFYGAVITFSRFDKRFDMGRYQVGATTLYVNRGIGNESRVPRLRFLCRPEVTVFDLVGIGTGSGGHADAPAAIR